MPGVRSQGRREAPFIAAPAGRAVQALICIAVRALICIERLIKRIDCSIIYENNARRDVSTINARICVLFNHKGGVSKTTATFNIGWKIAQMGKKVLLVDGDPQCNLTGLIMGEHFDDYYSAQETKNNNIKDGVRVAFEGKPQPITAIDCYAVPQNQNLYLIPGHMDLAEFDGSLSLAMNSNNAITTLQNLPGSFYELICKCCDRYSVDYVFIDMNPGLSSINEAFFVSCDGFVIPTNPDPFATMALKTLSTVLPRWKSWATTTRNFLANASYPLPNAEMKFCGFLVQRFSLRHGSPTRLFQERIDEIQKCISEEVVPALDSSEMISVKLHEINPNYCLGEIPDFDGLNQKASDNCVPVFALDKSNVRETGVVLEQMLEKINDLDSKFTGIAVAIMEQLSC